MVDEERAGETHYDTLGLSVKASREQVEKAYRFRIEMYQEDALATYSLLDPRDKEAARSRLTRAYEVLADPERRREYDLSRGIATTPTPVLPFPSAAPGALEPAPVAEPLGLPSGPVSGGQLRRIRESRGVELREIAAVTKIGLRFLEYIEADRFELLPPTVYLRGFLQEYARALGIEPRRAVEGYMTRLPR